MAKEVIPPTPIPVCESSNAVNELYCAAYLNYSEDSFSDTSKELLNALRDEYDNIGYGGTTQSFIAHNTTVDQVQDVIIGKKIKEINKHSLDDHVILMQSGDDVMISVNIY